jgi:hypothetical protein
MATPRERVNDLTSVRDTARQEMPASVRDEVRVLGDVLGQVIAEYGGASPTNIDGFAAYFAEVTPVRELADSTLVRDRRIAAARRRSSRCVPFHGSLPGRRYASTGCSSTVASCHGRWSCAARPLMR